ncbi:putative 2,3-diketo-L-gulonate TRAP transporter small permease protein YiaM [Candidatus Filomicrobium marinum]|uniref:TRAP transporter small permease protein n=2 Tax=Filomicrobium TaxID=119044 RepID=A0A0D6JE09_9HYPH|nr:MULTISPECIES: TRAP transporter small permease [Filomicrobium]MCV0367905.1 TRAP transporter small permease [Filomicrobium sp.]CFX18640.1 putative 2,3-diketo-L-gulonate TRAP transporter small permease protein YiaM [Candidatus Filomicrobium marinum]CPR18406.1 putative 2,3-diketo-L-gulonate TRAP transporter small permease protein YiaM [Candidatus Filomicrobium marinum]SDO19756.1 TRAP-type C4-dicarboxylate transport system, small permease component [Filomicrobium insigne]
MKIVQKILDFSEHILAAICVVCFAAMFVLGVATVFFRFVVESSLAFPDELIRYLFVWVMFLGSAVALRRNSHAAIGIFIDQLPDGAKRVALLFASLASALFFTILVVKGGELTLRVMPQISPALEVSMAWVYAAVPVGAAFMLIYVVELFVRQLTAPASELVSSGS